MAVTSTNTAAAKPADAEKKSGIRNFKASEIIFKENDPAESLYIIQKGQIRLFLPKGKGFVEIAILRQGEVIGEMAYFDESNRRRSCSAQAIVGTDVIEISFPAFAKTMASLNPWFRTIINTLVERLKKTNDRVKALESNSVGFGKDGKVSEYKFFHNIDIVRIMSMMYLVYKAHGEVLNGLHLIPIDKLKMYMIDIYNVQDIKYEEFINVLVSEGLGGPLPVEGGVGVPKFIAVKDPEGIRSVMLFLNNQRILDDAKKTKISHRAQILLFSILAQLSSMDAHVENAEVNLTAIFNQFKEKNITIGDDEFKEVVVAGLATEIIVNKDNHLVSNVFLKKLRQLFPAIKMNNAIAKINEVKAK